MELVVAVVALAVVVVVVVAELAFEAEAAVEKLVVAAAVGEVVGFAICLKIFFAQENLLAMESLQHSLHFQNVLFALLAIS
ncbi:hypothetical protein R83H12_02635 [Fibrobacteria bacterium R8-3-H12]